jgi:hypothetical protein
MNERPEIHVSRFPFNMQHWYEEKLTIAMNALNRIKKLIDQPSDDINIRELIAENLETAMIYTQTVLDISTGND